MNPGSRLDSGKNKYMMAYFHQRNRGFTAALHTLIGTCSCPAGHGTGCGCDQEMQGVKREQRRYGSCHPSREKVLAKEGF
jgi:hypothetical protein